MFNPIKRIWIPPHARPAQPAAVAQQTPEAPEPDDYFLNALPEPEVEEKDTDSIWAEFNSAHGTFTSSE
jgi:hypothetical protein